MRHLTTYKSLGFTRETRFRTGKHFWHLSHKASFYNALFADCLIMVMEKPRAA